MIADSGGSSIFKGVVATILDNVMWSTEKWLSHREASCPEEVGSRREDGSQSEQVEEAEKCRLAVDEEWELGSVNALGISGG